MKQVCKKCKHEFKDGDRVIATVLSVYRQISSSVSYAIERPYECLSLEHVKCAGLEEETA
jgi:hypothetical protein